MTTEIALSGACGNSPKNAFAEQFAVTLLIVDSKKLSGWLTQDCLAALPGAEPAKGIEAVRALVSENLSLPDAITIAHAITHGRIGAVNGTVTIAGAQRGFALFAEFKTTKAESVSSLRLYWS